MENTSNCLFMLSFSSKTKIYIKLFWLHCDADDLFHEESQAQDLHLQNKIVRCTFHHGQTPAFTWNIGRRLKRLRVRYHTNFFRFQHFEHFSQCPSTGADEQELATPILSLCHGIFTDWSIFSTPFLLWEKGSSGPVTQWRQVVSCDWLWHSRGSLIQSRSKNKSVDENAVAEI